MTATLLGELKVRLERERDLARTDGLTGIPDARAFKDASRARLGLAARHHHPAPVGYIDIDDFKAVNEASRHAEGDRLLQTVATTVAPSVGYADVVGRMGGDEFAVLLPETDGDEPKR